MSPQLSETEDKSTFFPPINKNPSLISVALSDEQKIIKKKVIQPYISPKIMIDKTNNPTIHKLLKRGVIVENGRQIGLPKYKLNEG